MYVGDRRHRPWPVWPLPFAVARPALTEPLVRSLRPVGRDEQSGLVAVVGPGGSGRTTLVREVCGLPGVRRWHSGGLVRLSFGAATTGPELAARIDAALETVTGARLGTSDPEQAAVALARATGDRLVVVDEVWHPEHVALCRPSVGAQRWVVVARDESLLPEGSTVVRTVPMGLEEAMELLDRDTVGMPDEVAAELFRHTGGLPLLLAVAGRAFGRSYRRTSDRDDVGRRLERAGGDVLAVALDLLSTPVRPRCLDLAIFPPDEDIPSDLLRSLWVTTPDDGDRTCAELSDAGLVVRTAGAVRVPEPIHAWLAERLGAAGARAAHERLVDAVSEGPAWTLPGVVTDRLAGHLAGAGRDAELAALVTDPRWVGRRLRDGGNAAVAADLAVAGMSGGVLARRLRTEETLYANLVPPEAIAVALADRLDDGELLRAGLPVPHLAARWPLPDAQPALRQRILVQGVESSQVNVVMAPDGSWFADTGNPWAGWVTVIDSATGRLVAGLFSGHAYSADVSADGRWLVTVPGEGPTQLWDTRTWTLAHGLPRPAEGDTTDSVTFAPDGTWLVIGHGNGTVDIRDARSGARRLSFTAHDGRIRAVAVTADGASLITSSTDGSVRMWDPGTGTLRHDWPGHAVSHRRVPALAVAPDGTWLATGDADAVRIWDTISGALLHTLDMGARRLVAAPDGSWLAAAGTGPVVRVWDTARASLRHALPVHRDGATALVAGPDGSWLAAASKGDGQIRVWDTTTGELGTVLSSGGDGVGSLAVAPDGTWLVAGGVGVARIWDPRVSPRPGATPERAAPALLLAAAGSWLATTALTAIADGPVRIFDAGTGAQRHALTEDRGRVAALAAVADRLALGGGDAGTVRLWDPATDGPLQTVGELGGVLRELRAAPDGSWLAAAGDRAVRIWDLATGSRAVDLAAGKPTAAAPDGSWLAAAEEGAVGLWHPLTGTRLHTFPAADPAARRVAESIVVAPDGSWLALLPGGLGGRILRIWSSVTGELLGSLDCGDGVGAATEQWLITAGGNVLRIWDAATGTLRSIVDGPPGGRVQAVAATSTLVAVVVNHTFTDRSERGEIRVHALDTGKLLTTAVVSGNLSGCRWTETGLYAYGSAGLFAFSWIT